jgi:hypothetical protein
MQEGKQVEGNRNRGPDLEDLELWETLTGLGAGGV